MGADGERLKVSTVEEAQKFSQDEVSSGPAWDMCDPVSKDKEAESSTYQRDQEKIKFYQNLNLFFKNQC